MSKLKLIVALCLCAFVANKTTAQYEAIVNNAVDTKAIRYWDSLTYIQVKHILHVDSLIYGNGGGGGGGGGSVYDNTHDSLNIWSYRNLSELAAIWAKLNGMLMVSGTMGRNWNLNYHDTVNVRGTLPVYDNTHDSLQIWNYKNFNELLAIWTKLNSSVAVTGAFYQATQPVSLASVPTHAVTESGIWTITGNTDTGITGLKAHTNYILTEFKPGYIPSMTALPSGTYTVTGNTDTGITGLKAHTNYVLTEFKPGYIPSMTALPSGTYTVTGNTDTGITGLKAHTNYVLTEFKPGYIPSMTALPSGTYTVTGNTDTGITGLKAHTNYVLTEFKPGYIPSMTALPSGTYTVVTTLGDTGLSSGKGKVNVFGRGNQLKINSAGDIMVALDSTWWPGFISHGAVSGGGGGSVYDNTHDSINNWMYRLWSNVSSQKLDSNVIISQQLVPGDSVLHSSWINVNGYLSGGLWFWYGRDSTLALDTGVTIRVDISPQQNGNGAFASYVLYTTGAASQNIEKITGKSYGGNNIISMSTTTNMLKEQWYYVKDYTTQANGEWIRVKLPKSSYLVLEDNLVNVHGGGGAGDFSSVITGAEVGFLKLDYSNVYSYRVTIDNSSASGSNPGSRYGIHIKCLVDYNKTK